MVVPLGGLDMPPGSMEAPQYVKEYHAIWWWAVVLIFAYLCIARFVAMDVFGAFNTGIMCYLAWYLVSDQCAKMSQCCVLYFGIMCLTNGLFDLLPLLAGLGGRVAEFTEYGKSSETGATTYTVTIERHPFFDGSMGNFYNYQSCCMIACPIVMLLGTLMAYTTYSAYATSLFADSDDEALRPFVPGRGWQTGPQRIGGNLGGGGGPYGGGPGAPQGYNRPVSPRFEGRGHRLGR